MVTRKKKQEHVNHERWLVSYADFITLLFAFFTTMYAISTVDAQKMGKMVMSMRASFDRTLFGAGSDHLTLNPGVSGSATGQDMVEDLKTARSATSDDSELSPAVGLRSSLEARDAVVSSERVLTTLRRNVETLVGPEALRNRVRTRMEGRGLIISLGEGGFFDSGSDILKPEGRALLDVIAGTLEPTDNHIRIEGHTDNIPIRNTRFPSNWELSTARATAVIAYMIERFHFSPDRLSAAGYSEYRPVDTNDTVEGRSRNRRVDIVILHPRYAEAEPR